MIYTEEEIKGIISGCLLGDAGRSRSTFLFTHATKQTEYALFKKNLLDGYLNKNCPISYNTNRQEYPWIRCYVPTTELTKSLVLSLYGVKSPSAKGKKYVTQEFLNNLTLLGIAIWYMDDGSLSYKKRNGKIHSMEVTLNTYISIEENKAIISYFWEKWGIKWTTNKGKGKYRLRMGTKEGRRFFSLITPYVISSMYYKINLGTDGLPIWKSNQ